jgi:hypothetical protein
MRASRWLMLAATVLSVPVAAAPLSGKVARAFRPPASGARILAAGRGDPLGYSSCEVGYRWTSRAADGAVVREGVEPPQPLDEGLLTIDGHRLGVTLRDLRLGETWREWVGAVAIVDVTITSARCPRLPGGLSVAPGRVMRGGVAGALEVDGGHTGGALWLVNARVVGDALVVDYEMSESLETWTQRYPLAAVEARLAYAEAGRARAAHDPATALAALRRALGLDPTLRAAVVDLAEALLGAGQPDEALAAVAGLARAAPGWLFVQVADRPALAPLRAALPQVAPGHATIAKDGPFVAAYSPALDLIAVPQRTDYDGNGGSTWVDLLDADDQVVASYAVQRCDGSGMTCEVDPAAQRRLAAALITLGFEPGEAATSVGDCRFRFPTGHLGIACDASHVRVLSRDDVLVEAPNQQSYYDWAVRFPGLVVLGTRHDGYGKQTITGAQRLRSPRLP